MFSTYAIAFAALLVSPLVVQAMPVSSSTMTEALPVSDIDGSLTNRASHLNGGTFYIPGNDPGKFFGGLEPPNKK
jgi:hypothetical protein